MCKFITTRMEKEITEKYVLKRKQKYCQIAIYIYIYLQHQFTHVQKSIPNESVYSPSKNGVVTYILFHGLQWIDIIRQHDHANIPSFNVHCLECGDLPLLRDVGKDIITCHRRQQCLNSHIGHHGAVGHGNITHNWKDLSRFRNPSIPQLKSPPHLRA